MCYPRGKCNSWTCNCSSNHINSLRSSCNSFPRRPSLIFIKNHKPNCVWPCRPPRLINYPLFLRSKSRLSGFATNTNCGLVSRNPTSNGLGRKSQGRARYHCPYNLRRLPVLSIDRQFFVRSYHIAVFWRLDSIESGHDTYACQVPCKAVLPIPLDEIIPPCAKPSGA